MRRMDAAAREAAGDSFEIVLVNDGSRDRTWACIRALATQSPRIVGVDLSRNHGHQLAVSAGLEQAPWRAGADHRRRPAGSARTAGPDDGSHERGLRRRFRQARRARRRKRPQTGQRQKIFYRLLGAISEIEIPPDVGDFRLISRRMVDRLIAMPERDRFPARHGGMARRAPDGGELPARPTPGRPDILHAGKDDPAGGRRTDGILGRAPEAGGDPRRHGACCSAA